MPARGANGRGLGTAEGTIRLDYDDSGARAASKSLAGIGKTAQDSGRQVKNAGATMAAAGAVIAGGFVMAVRSAANFEAALSAVAAVSGATTQQMDAVRAKALQLGKDTMFSSSEAANAMEELVKAGVSIPDVLNGASDAALALAAATGIDMPRAAGISSNAMNEFKLAATDLPGVVNRLAGAANASAIDITELGDALSYVGPVAHALGLSINDTATAIAILGNNGIKGSSAGTALRAILSNLTPITKRATTEFERLGLVTADGTNLFLDANGALLPLDQIIQVLNDHTKNLNATQKNTFAKKAFGLESLAAASVLMGETAGSVDAMNDAIRKTTAADVAKTRMDNLRGSIEQLKGSLETAVNSSLAPFLGAIGQVVDGIKTMVDVFLKLPAPIRNLITLAGGLSGAFLLIAGSALLVIPKLVEMKRTFDALAATATFQKIAANIQLVVSKIGGPWVAALAAVATVIGVLVAMNRKGKESFDDLTAAIEADGYAIGKQAREIRGNTLETSGALAVADKYHIALSDITAASLDSADAQKRVADQIAAARAPLQGQIDDLSRQTNASGTYTKATYDKIAALRAEQAELDGLSNAYRSGSKSAVANIAEADRLRRAKEAETVATTAAATAIEDRLNRALGRTGPLARDAAGGAAKAASAVKGVGTEADTTAAEVKALNDGLDDLFDFSAGRALDDIHTKFKALRQEVKDNGTALNGYSDNALKNRNTLRDDAEAIGAWGHALSKDGVVPDEVTYQMGVMRDQLIKNATAAGFNRSEVVKLIDKVNNIPKDVTLGIHVQTAQAKDDIVNFQASVDKLHGKDILIGVSERTGVGVTIPKAASGGIVQRATHVIVGEAGPEVIAPLPDLARSFLDIYRAGRVNLADMDGGSARSRGGSSSPQGSGSSRLVRGELDITPRGKAYIRGVAEDVTDANDQFTRAHARMG